ncbi:uncharacterized Nudix hydrolase NudL-like isoform X2 [Gigantopelta aegis]|nr:uncharacterized Nudix hydrolase NudL-like isoform X2 [Gigantopelta aegis]XP_041376595.1 uncharacterized Nudix hydrolase NudL-like isoform X2 [Gigantopelta aegis]
MTSSEAGREVDDITDIRQRFHRYDIRNGAVNIPSDSLYPHLKRASVLVPIFLKNQQWRILLTVRSHKLRTHTGSVALPGGLRDDSDVDEVDTAIREAEEEIGLLRRDVTVLAVLFPNIVRPGYIVFPVVAVIPSWFQARPNPDEVATVFDLPLDTFLHDFRVQNWSMFSIDISIVHFPRFVDSVKMDIWGFTARLCMWTANIVYNTGGTIGGLSDRRACAGDDVYSQHRFLFYYLCQHSRM